MPKAGVQETSVNSASRSNGQIPKDITGASKDEEFHGKVVTGDEMFTDHYGPESKKPCNEWRYADLPQTRYLARDPKLGRFRRVVWIRTESR